MNNGRHVARKVKDGFARQANDDIRQMRFYLETPSCTPVNIIISYNFLTCGPYRSLGSIVDPQFIENMYDVAFYGMRADIELS